MRAHCLSILSALLMCLVAIGCQTEPKTEAKRENLSADVEASMKRMKSIDPGLDDQVNKAYGYALFPSVGKGGFIVGGSYGRGEVYEQGKMAGFADITQATVGLQAGGQTFSEIILFEHKQAMDNFKNGKLKFAANASAVALKAGSAASVKYNDGVAVIIAPEGGLMVEASIGGQSFSFQPK